MSACCAVTAADSVGWEGNSLEARRAVGSAASRSSAGCTPPGDGNCEAWGGRMEETSWLLTGHWDGCPQWSARACEQCESDARFRAAAVFVPISVHAPSVASRAVARAKA